MIGLFHSKLRYLVSCGREVVLPLGVLVSGVVFQNLVNFAPWLVERFYSRAIYPRVLVALSPLSRGLSFSVGEVLTWLIFLKACAGVVLFCAGLLRKRSDRRSWSLTWLRYGLWVSAVLLWSFLFVFGLNYQRPLLFELLGYEQRKAEPAELEDLGRLMIERVNQTYVEAHEGGRPIPGREEVVRLLSESYDTAPE